MIRPLTESPRDSRRRSDALELLRHLASRPGHDEVKADFRQLLIEEFGAKLESLEFERRVPEVRGRLDALIGRTVFEAKRNLDREWEDVVRRMPDYLADREREEGEKFSGIASDGLKWVLFELCDGELTKIKEATLDPDTGDSFLAFLDSALTLKTALSPDPLNIRAQLGPDSPPYRRAATELARLWTELKHDKAVQLKRQLWAQLLKLVYGRELESDTLFFQHTFLVVVAKAVALAVLGLRDDEPKRVLSGAAFEAAGVYGAAESDFFDWVVAAPAGEALVRRILNHVRRFRLDQVECDVLKILYESLIDRSERHGLGEYYTPDWLAAKIVRRAVERPIEQRVLDPACGSGTFLFHAVRNFLADAEESGLEETIRAQEATQHIAGMDIHPVAVIIARVTYLLALQPVISTRSGSLSIPVYLGDAMQLSTSSLMGVKELTIHVPPPKSGTALKFPEIFCKDIQLFDKLIGRMRNAADQRLTQAQVERGFKLEVERHYKRDANKPELDGIHELGKTYLTFDCLVREGRDSVWSYVARNLSRPLALAFGAGWANVVVGNPPWLAFRHMSPDLQNRFRELARGERVYVGGRFATQNDLCALFSVRAVALYLRSGGRIAFVLPLAALTRGQFENFRKGSFHTAKIAWEEVWTMDDSVQPLFPVPSCVVFGRRRALSKNMPEQVTAYSGLLPMRDANEEMADEHLDVHRGAPRPEEGVFTGGSVYRELFKNGATLFPRMLCMVDRKPAGRLGGDPTAPYVISHRSRQEKPPWKSLPAIENRVESEFVYPIILGENILPFRLFGRIEAVVPVTERGNILDAAAAASRGFDGLHGWMRKAESFWNDHRLSDLTLTEQFDYYGKLKAQFPPRRTRLLYAKSGTLPAATILRGDNIIDHTAYWAPLHSEEEGYYLASILNSEAARSRAASMQSRGQWGARHFDKVMFTLPIPLFDGKIALHRRLSALGRRAEAASSKLEFSEKTKFQAARKIVRQKLVGAGLTREIEAAVSELFGAPKRDK